MAAAAAADTAKSSRMGKPWWGSQRRKMALTVTSAIMVRPHASVVRSGWSPGSPGGPGSGSLVRTTGLTPEDKDQDDGGSQCPCAGQQRNNERQRDGGTGSLGGVWLLGTGPA